MPDVTFRDFAGALMAQDDAAAGRVLQTLLGVDEAAAAAGTTYFKEQMQKSPDFMMKAMGMRQAVESRDAGQLETLLVECFGYAPSSAAASAKNLLAHYD